MSHCLNRETKIQHGIIAYAEKLISEFLCGDKTKTKIWLQIELPFLIQVTNRFNESCILKVSKNQNDNYFWLYYWAAEQQFSWIIASWWLSVSLWRIFITFVWPRSTFCINKTVPGFLDVIPFQSLDVTIFVIVQLNTLTYNAVCQPSLCYLAYYWVL